MYVLSDEILCAHDLHDYRLFRNQIEVMQTITFGSPINVLLITDRLHGCAQGLLEYLQNSTDITVDIVYVLSDAVELLQKKPFDFLIIVGYLKDKSNYDVIPYFKRINEYSIALIYALLDNVIQLEQLKYGIEIAYERTAPADGFVSCMRELHAEATQLMHTAVSPSATRKQMWLEALQEIRRVEEEQEKKAQRARTSFFARLLLRLSGK